MPALGPRELDVLDQLWRHGKLSAQQLLSHLNADLSLNTVQSTLERLHRKGLLERTKDGRAFFYSASMTRAEVVSRVLNDLARDVGRGDLAPIVAGFAEFLSSGQSNPNKTNTHAHTKNNDPAGDETKSTPDIEAQLLKILEATQTTTNDASESK